jgi:hypothetical protein
MVPGKAERSFVSPAVQAFLDSDEYRSQNYETWFCTKRPIHVWISRLHAWENDFPRLYKRLKALVDETCEDEICLALFATRKVSCS